MRESSVGVVGATGALGRELVQILEGRQFPVSSLKVFATEGSVGERIEYLGNELSVEKLTADALLGCEILFFATPREITREYAPDAANGGSFIVDSSGAFGELAVVPEVNGDALRAALRLGRRGVIISSPSGAAIQLAVALKPIQSFVSRAVVTTLEPVSTIGQRGVDELSKQVLELFNGTDSEPEHFPARMAFNCIPQVGSFLPNGTTEGEERIQGELATLLGTDSIHVTATTVRVPTFSCISQSVVCDLTGDLTADEARELLRQSPGIVVSDDPQNGVYPMNAELVGSDAVYVGRIRSESPRELLLWIASDNLRKGGALNMVQIAEIAITEWARN